MPRDPSVSSPTITNFLSMSLLIFVQLMDLIKHKTIKQNLSRDIYISYGNYQSIYTYEF